MSVKIRLRRIGRKKQPSYRVVATESTSPRDGAYLEMVGFYNPRRQPAELRMDLERVDHWIAQGADLTDTVASLLRKARKGGDKKVELRPMKEVKPVQTADVVPAAEPRATRAGSRGRGTAAPAAAPAAGAEAAEDDTQAVAEVASEPLPERGETGPLGTPTAAETAE